ncbi:MAG TPA: DUF4388 domain-containing protein [Ktedonobacteraceae bacterium]|nr:DUF4388 domain-containing protein [Ktedonobacteraceae bacterium]
MSQHEMATDRLVSIIQSIQMSQGSGVLTVRRGEGGMLEEGMIVFLNGQVKQTAVGRRTGTEARNWLSTWGPCRYIFVASNSADYTQPGFTNPDSGKGQQRPEANYKNPMAKQQALSRINKGSINVNPTLTHEEALYKITINKLTRSHLRLFLLIDGHRPIEELARLVGKNPIDIRILLNDLEDIGIIHSGGF